jgi:hypothetical protein
MRLKLKMPNGDEIEAPIPEWVAAIMISLPQEQRQAICDKIKTKRIFYTTPGSHILHAEGGCIQLGGRTPEKQG